MKQRALIVFLLYFLIFHKASLWACEFDLVHLGNFKIFNEQNQTLNHCRVYSYYSDDTMIEELRVRKPRISGTNKEVENCNIYQFYGQYWMLYSDYFITDSFSRRFLIQCDGYYDLVLNDMTFIYNSTGNARDIPELTLYMKSKSNYVPQEKLNQLGQIVIDSALKCSSFQALCMQDDEVKPNKKPPESDAISSATITGLVDVQL